MEGALRSILTGAAGVTGIVGTAIYWGLAPQDRALPFVVLNTVSGVPDYALSGATGLTGSRVQVDCYAASYSGAKYLARAVIAAVSAYRGEVSSVHFGGIFIDSERDLNEPQQGDTATRFRVSIDLSVWWRAA